MSSGWVFVTSNNNKWLEAQRILGYALERVELELDEGSDAPEDPAGDVSIRHRIDTVCRSSME